MVDKIKEITRYFHSLATSSKRVNTINVIEHEGQLYISQNVKAVMFWNFDVYLTGQNSKEMPHIN